MVVRVRPKPLQKLLLAVAADLLIFVGSGGVLVWVWGISDGALYQYAQGVHFAREVSDAGLLSTSNPAPSPTGVPLAIANFLAPRLARRDSQLIGRLEIPSVRLSVMVSEGVDDASLRKAAGHLPSSALPGDAGNFVLLGHRDTFFRPLRGIAQGDTVRVRSRGEVFSYTVDSIRIESPELSWAVQETSAPMLTLITCFPFDYVGPAPRRFVVQARMTAAETEPAVHRQSPEMGPREVQQ
jgi:sortase A